MLRIFHKTLQAGNRRSTRDHHRVGSEIAAARRPRQGAGCAGNRICGELPAVRLHSAADVSLPLFLRAGIQRALRCSRRRRVGGLGRRLRRVHAQFALVALLRRPPRGGLAALPVPRATVVRR